MTFNEKLIVDVLTSELDLTANTGIAELLSAARKILSVIQLGDDCQPQLQQTPCKTLLPPSGIEEYDELVKQYQNSEIDFLALTCGLWNKGYNAGKEYCSGGK